MLALLSKTEPGSWTSWTVAEKEKNSYHYCYSATRRVELRSTGAPRNNESEQWKTMKTKKEPSSTSNASKTDGQKKKAENAKPETWHKRLLEVIII